MGNLSSKKHERLPHRAKSSLTPSRGIDHKFNKDLFKQLQLLLIHFQ
jgi:hypothetical protein